MSSAKVILILTKEVSVYETFRDKLQDIFGLDVQIRSNLYPPVNMYEVDLILSSGSKEIFRDVVEPLDKRIPFIQANRSIDFNKLEKLLDLPANTKCLLVSNETGIAKDSVLLLKRFGFEHLEIVPYSPEMEVNVSELKRFDVAITHGLVGLVPAEVKKIFDLGDRSLDLSTIFEISNVLMVSLDKMHLFTSNYFRNFIRIGKKLSNSIQREKYINKKLEIVLDAAHEGIIWVDQEGIITVFNEEATNILGINYDNAIGKHYTEIVRDLHIDEVMNNKKEIPRQIIQVQGLQILITKTPILLDDVFFGAVITFQDVSHVQRMEQEIRKKKTESGLTTKYTFNSIIGKSAMIEQIKTIAKKLAKSDHTILITGESGTGKEIFAQAIHDYSSRKIGPFVAVNFAGITQSLAESELFGYEEGAFTGARRGGNVGLFELAQNGTIFLDEIGDAPLNIQAAILRVLQEKQVMRVGGSKVIPVNVRVIAATNKNLNQMIKEGSFREDLFYRLNQLPLEILPLRQRKADIQCLINHFLKEKGIKMRFTVELIEFIEEYSWPGNIRELEAFINYLTLAADGVQAGLNHLPPNMKRNNSTEHQVGHTLRYLVSQGETDVYKKILEVLAFHTDQTFGIGRGLIKNLVDIEISESQLRTKLNVLRRGRCISIGTKKQGTRLTEIGSKVLEKL
ncbi:sigma-54 interaction domain-containing protein [Virgibacillus salexigens]|uniref:sigma-54 interaction domain-containing protein n=1 Tax=Virgibacillus salexigens TaxID=61016 RepID=UPI00190BA9FB|nr:sigma 54-interacting transcriptional regulator [Virgibacillus salexigens]